MSRYALESALPEPVLARLADFAEVDPAPVIEFDSGSAAALAKAEFLVTGWGCPAVTAEVLAMAPRLRLIAHAAGTVKHHLGPEVWERGIAVSSAAAANAEPVAEYTRAMIVLSLKRAFRRAAEYPVTGWPDDSARNASGYIGRTVGIIGASRIGRRVLELLRGCDMRLLLADPYCDGPTAAGLGAELVELDELCGSSDVVSIHAPQLSATRHLIDDRRLSLMRDGAVLINTARGSLVDSQALLDHCRSGRIEAVLDVTDPEPLPGDHPLLKLPNVFVTPHIAGAQGTEIAMLGGYAVAEARRFFTGEPLHGQVRAEDLATMA